MMEADRRNELKFSSRIHLRICLEGGYHVLDESTLYSSDQRPTARQLWKQPIGVLEVGILGAQGLLPMKMRVGHGSTDAYCVAKYGQKWVGVKKPLQALWPGIQELECVKKMGELQLAVRFTSLSLANMIYIYGQPLLPKMH
ncbi:hypothetical protein ACSQ67_005601 [Phaseolus vulgaris]